MIGKGTYGKVYEAVHKLTKLKVAIKSIEKIHCRSPDVMPKIFNEVDILCKLEHQNVIKIYEIFEN